MVTSRTGTAVHKRMAATTLARGRADGVTHCPRCGVELDYDTGRRPNSAEADEYPPFSITGRTSTDPEHWSVLCRTCNQSLGDKPRELTTIDANAADPFPLSVDW